MRTLTHLNTFDAQQLTTPAPRRMHRERSKAPADDLADRADVEVSLRRAVWPTTFPRWPRGWLAVVDGRMAVRRDVGRHWKFLAANGYPLDDLRAQLRRVI